MSTPPQQPDTRNLVLAVGLCLAIIFGFQYFYEAPRAREAAAARQQAAAAQGTASPEAAASNPAAGGQSGPQAASAGAAPVAPRNLPRPQALALNPRIGFDTPAVDGSISANGARFDDLRMKRYRTTIESGAPEVTLLHPQGTAQGHYAFFGYATPDGGVSLPGPNTVWTMSANRTLTPDTPLVLTWDNGQGLRFTRTISVDGDYTFRVEDQVANAGQTAINLQPYGAIRRHAKPDDPPNAVIHEGMIGVLDGKLRQLKYNKLEKGESLTQRTQGGWLGYSDKFWMSALIPDQKSRLEAHYRTARIGGEDVFEAAYVGEAQVLAPGQSRTVVQHLYAGAKRVDHLRATGERLGLQRFDDAVDWGMFFFLTKPFYWLLDLFNGLVKGNIGLAILMVTVVVKIATFPLVYQSYKSFARLRELAPKMAEIKERFAADAQRQQQETIKLYQSEKINPVAGCVPALLQMPIFFALFKVLSISLELRHAPFYGWIEDLSARDPTSVFNLFGLLPWDPGSVPVIGSWLVIGVWPILYGLSFWLLQKMQPPATDKLQAQIFGMMPWLFVVIFAPFAAGLVIYYTWSNLLTIVQQYAIARRMKASNPIDEFFARLSAGGAKATGAK